MVWFVLIGNSLFSIPQWIKLGVPILLFLLLISSWVPSQNFFLVCVCVEGATLKVKLHANKTNIG
jgi:hypothetical protein